MNDKINSFLSVQKKRLTETGTVTVVMGNEAADLDSMVSAVTYAYLSSVDNGDSAIVPLINIPGEDYKLRTEAVYLFSETGIDSNLFFFAEDINLDALKSENRLKLVLVDHNRLASKQEGLQECIVEIIDHHKDEGVYPGKAETDIRPVGSASTIVAERFLSSHPDMVDSDLGKLFLGTILLDTVNMDPEAKRVTDADTAVVEKLIEMNGLDRQDLFDKLQFEKFNVSSLGTYDLLRKDYKEWEFSRAKCGIGAVLLPIRDWVDKENNLEADCLRFLEERKLDVLLAMNAFTSPAFTRQLAVIVPDEKLRADTVAFLEGTEMGLHKMDIDAGICLFFNQDNLGVSRKKLQPLLADFFN